jgi:TatD DNase family protein
MPRERVLTESDGPFAQLHGKAVMPWQVEKAIGELSQIWSLPTEEVDQNVHRNLQSLLARHLPAGEIVAAPL